MNPAMLLLFARLINSQDVVLMTSIKSLEVLAADSVGR